MRSRYPYILCTEALFDIARANHLQFHLNPTGSLAPRLTILSISELLDGIHSELALWQTLSLKPAYLDQMPRLDLPEVLEGQVPKPIFVRWQKIFQSQQTLRELAVTLSKKPTEIGRLLMSGSGHGFGAIGVRCLPHQTLPGI